MLSNRYTGSDQERCHPSSRKQRIDQLGSRRQIEKARCTVDFRSLVFGFLLRARLGPTWRPLNSSSLTEPGVLISRTLWASSSSIQRVPRFPEHS